MADRDWDKELAKIDKQLESMSDEALLSDARRRRRKRPEGGRRREARANLREAADDERRSACLRAAHCCRSRSASAWCFWPYAARCGVGLVGYLAAVGRRDRRAASGARSGPGGIARAARTSLSLLLILWGAGPRRDGGAAAHRLREARRAASGDVGVSSEAGVA